MDCLAGIGEGVVLARTALSATTTTTEKHWQLYFATPVETCVRTVTGQIYLTNIMHPFSLFLSKI